MKVTIVDNEVTVEDGPARRVLPSRSIVSGGAMSTSVKTAKVLPEPTKQGNSNPINPVVSGYYASFSQP